MRRMSFTALVLVSIVPVAMLACGSEQKEAQTPATVSVTKPTAESTAGAEPKEAPVAKPPQKSMAEMQRKAISGAQGAFNAHDAKRLVSFYSGDCTLRSPSRDGWKEEAGRDAMEKSHADLFAALPDLKIATSRVLQKGDAAVWEWASNGTDTVGMKGEKPTGKAFGFNAVSVLWFDADGLIKQDWTYFDNATIATQLGKGPKDRKVRPIPNLPGGDIMWIEGKGDDKEAKNGDLVKAFYASFEKKDEKGFVSLLDDNVVYADQADPADIAGKDNGKKGFAGFVKAFPDVKIAADYLWPSSDFVAAVGVWTGTNKGPLPPMITKATGKPVNYHFVDVIELRDGKIVKATSYSNSNELAGQLGLLPKMKEPTKEPTKEPMKGPMKEKGAKKGAN